MEIIFKTSGGIETMEGPVPVLPNQENTVTLSFESPNGDNDIAALLYSIYMRDAAIENVRVDIMATLDGSKVSEAFEVKPLETGMFMIPEEYRNIPLTEASLTFITPGIENIRIDLEGCIKVGESHILIC